MINPYYETPEAIEQRYRSLLKGWQREQKEGVLYWMSSEEKRNYKYNEKKKLLRREKRELRKL